MLWNKEKKLVAIAGVLAMEPEVMVLARLNLFYVALRYVMLTPFGLGIGKCALFRIKK